MSEDSYNKRYPSFDVWIKQCHENPTFKGADWSRIDLITRFYDENIKFGPSPGLRRTWERELALKLIP